MSRTAYIVTGIRWAGTGKSFPTDATVSVPNALTDLGYEDFEREGYFDFFDDLDEDQIAEFWDDYEPTLDAEEGFEQAWDDEIKRLLEAMFGLSPLSFASFQPSTEAHQIAA